MWKGERTMLDLTAREVEEKLKKQETLSIIDVREDEELLTGKIPGAVHIPLGILMSSLHQLDKEKEYILVCHSGARSGMAKQMLELEGFSAANMIDGMVEWNGLIV